MGKTKNHFKIFLSQHALNLMMTASLTRSISGQDIFPAFLATLTRPRRRYISALGGKANHLAGYVFAANVLHCYCVAIVRKLQCMASLTTLGHYRPEQYEKQ
jgi:hypothetical protein